MKQIAIGLALFPLMPTNRITQQSVMPNRIDPRALTKPFSMTMTSMGLDYKLWNLPASR